MPTPLWSRNSGLDRFQSLADPEADGAISVLLSRKVRPSSDTVTELLRLRRSKDLPSGDKEALERFFEQTSQEPDWVDWESVARGQRFMASQALPVSASFLLGGLIESYTVPTVASVLCQTGRLSKTTARRIFETGQMVFDCAVEDNVKPGRMGHRTLLRVRLLHAFVRHHMQGRTEAQAMNQLEMAFVLGMFNVGILRGVERLGLRVSRQEAQDYHQLWRTAGYYLGMHDDLLPETIEDARRLQAAIGEHLQEPNDDSRLLAHSVVEALEGRPPFLLSKRALYALARQLLGPELSQALELPGSRFWAAVFKASSPVVLASGLAQRRSPWLDQKSQEFGLAFGSWALGLGLKRQPADFRPLAAKNSD